MLSAFHIEIAIPSCIGGQLEDRGGTTALSNAGITTPGNDALLTGYAVGKSKYMHQVTARALHQLMVCAYIKWIESNSTNSPPSLKESRASIEQQKPKFQF